MRLAARMKLGYYPLPVEHGPRIRSRLVFPEAISTALDPCAGTGAALKEITAEANSTLYGVELDANRAQTATAAGLKMIQGNAFDVRGRVERLSLLYLNPPYDFEVGPLANKRMERLFLQHTYAWLKPKGILVMVIPGDAVVDVAETLGARFKDIRIYRMDGELAEKYDQYAVFGIRGNNGATAAEQITAHIKHVMGRRRQVPVLSEAPDALYQVPPSTDDVILTYTGIPLDAVEDRLHTSVAWFHALPHLLPQLEVVGGRPITPLHGGHVGLLATSGMLNGVFGNGDQKHIARWRPVKHTTTTEEIVGDEKITRIKERFSNELSLVFVTGDTSILTETPKATTTLDAGTVEEPSADNLEVDEPIAASEDEVEEDGFDSDEYLEEAGTEVGIEKSFPLGHTVMTTYVRNLATQHGVDLYSLLARHSQGDWGDLNHFDARRNDEAVDRGDGRILSSYVVPGFPEDGFVWIVTEHDRSATTIMLASEFN